MRIVVYAVPPAMKFLSHFPETSRGILVIPSLILYSMPSWFTGIALLGMFIGGLVPAASYRTTSPHMAISQANLLTRNIIKKVRPHTSATSEIRITKISSTVFKFIALGFVFTIPATYAISLQLFGGILIIQTLPAVFFGLYVKSLTKEPLIAGLIVGLVSGILMVEYTNHFGALTSSLFNIPFFGSLYVAIVALALNIVV